MKDEEHISPLDDRYYKECRALAKYFSEEGLLRERVAVEVSYLSLLKKIGVAPDLRIPAVHIPYLEFKKKELRVGHDVKAVELCIRDFLTRRRREDSSGLAPFIHLGLTSEDVNSVAYGNILKKSLEKVLIPTYERLVRRLVIIAQGEAETKMVGRTHGRPAIPTTFGKEISVYAYRLDERLRVLRRMRPAAKVSGAVGTYASFYLIKRDVEWPKVLREFVESFGLDFIPYTTQIAPSERLSDILHVITSINQVVIGLVRDLWIYQTMGDIFFDTKGKVGSSTMPQKVNPVDIENAEGQAEISSSLLTFMSYKLQLNRLQRDLSDSPVKRNIGVALAHSLISCKRVLEALGVMRVNRKKMAADLASEKDIFAEPVQLLMRLRGDVRGYERVKKQVEEGNFSLPAEFTSQIGEYLGVARELAKFSLLGGKERNREQNDTD